MLILSGNSFDSRFPHSDWFFPSRSDCKFFHIIEKAAMVNLFPRLTNGRVRQK